MEGRARSGRFKVKEVKKRRRMVCSELEEHEVRKGDDKESSLPSKGNGFDDHHVECGKDEVNWIGKKRKLDVFEFDEYDRFDADLMLKKNGRNDEQFDEDEGKAVRGASDAQQTLSEAGTSGGKVIVYKRRSSFKNDSDRSSGLRNKNTGQSVNRKADSLFSSKKPSVSLESIRFQGKNGIVKVQVNKPNGSNSLETCSRLEAEDIETSKDDTVVRDKLAYSSSVLQSRFDQQFGTVGRTGKAFLNLHKSMSVKTSHKKDSEFEDSDTSSKSGKDLDSSKTVSRNRYKGKTATPAPPKKLPAVSRSEHVNSKRRGCTEKQKLREHIRKMLLDAGWTIDYRPRRNGGYNDAVYVNTSGTSYWSIIKAYDALQKETTDNERITSLEDSSFTPLPETILCKLTRSTRHKMAKEKKIKNHKSGRTFRLNQSSARLSKANSDSEETTSSEDEEDYEEEDEEEEKLIPLNKRSVGSVKVGNNSDNNRLHLQARKNKKLGKCTLLVRSANKGMNPSDGYVPYTGKRTLLSWLIDCGTVEVSEKIRYMNGTHKRTLQQGWITRDGIHCVCCSKIVSIANFEIHAGSKLRQPLQNIITESGTSLSQCLFDAWNQKNESARNYFHNVDVDGDDPNDDACSICGDGGDLICCDGCPSTFHQSCLGIEVLPAGDWHCPQCICLHCGMIDKTNVDSDTSKCSLQSCTLCEMKYHISCLKEVDSYADNSFCSSFCGTKCEELHKILQESVGVRIELEDGFSWSLVRRTVIDSDHSGDRTPQKLECNAKLAIAQTIMDECFLPIVDRRSQVNLIHNVLYNCGSNFNRVNYEGFYTAILEKGDEVISAASLRFHGTQFAEMPFIGTRHIYRRQGMCRRLFSAIESALRSYKVEKLVIPAISELLHTWIEVFGFHHIEQSNKEKLRSFNMMVFPGVDMLQKVLVDKDRSEDEPVVITGLFNTNELSFDLLCQDSGALTSPLHDKHACSEPGNRVDENMFETSCFPHEDNKVCDDDCVASVKKISSPDLSGSSDGHCREKLPHDKDENKEPELKSETKCPSHCIVADVDLENGRTSDVQLAEEADNDDLPTSCIAKLGSSDGFVELYPSDNNGGILIAFTDKKTVSGSLELFTPPLPEDRQSLVEVTIPEMVSEENSSDITASATTTKFNIQISFSDMNMEDAEVQRTARDGPSKEKVSLISTAYARVSSCIERDEDVDMSPAAYAADNSSTFPSDIVIGQ